MTRPISGKNGPLLPERAFQALRRLDPKLGILERIAELRRVLPPEEARRAAALFDLRRRAEGKLAGAEGLLLTPRGLEQATERRVAAARARRIAERGGGRWVLDATAGIGGDAVELARAGLRVAAAELDPERAACLAHNLVHGVASDGGPMRAGPAALAVRADALAPPIARPEDGLLVLDPDRRPQVDEGDEPDTAAGARRREGDPSAWAPPLADALRLAARFAGAVIKLPPAFEPVAVDGAHRWQWVSAGSELKEVALWLGCLALVDGQAPAPDEREATALRADGEPRSFVGVPREQPPLDDAAAHAARYLFEPDPAIIRAGLIGNLAAELGLAPLHAEIAYLGGAAPSTLPGMSGASELGRGYRVLDAAPLDKKRVRRMLAAHGVGPVTVKKRGHPEPADTLSRRLRGAGRRRGLLLVARLLRGHHAWLVEPDPARASEEHPA